MGVLIGILNVLVILSSILMIGLILIQRGKGGGLVGAFGGAGGSSAFGTKAGDVFTRVTIGLAAFWFLLCMSLVVLNQRTSRPSDLLAGPGTTPKAAGKAAPTDDAPKATKGTTPKDLLGTDKPSGASIPVETDDTPKGTGAAPATTPKAPDPLAPHAGSESPKSTAPAPATTPSSTPDKP